MQQYTTATNHPALSALPAQPAVAGTVAAPSTAAVTTMLQVPEVSGMAVAVAVAVAVAAAETVAIAIAVAVAVAVAAASQ